MRKKILLLMVMLLAAASVNAADWRLIETNNDSLRLFVDADSIRYISDHECLYAIKYKNGDEPYKVSYMKSDKNNYIGIIRTQDYEEGTYSPSKAFANPHAFMKPVPYDSMLASAHSYVVSDMNVKYITTDKAAMSSAGTLVDYASELAQELQKNWNPLKYWDKTDAEIVVTVGNDGSLQNYKFTKSTGVDKADRGIISAIEKTVPFDRISKFNKDNDSIKLKFRFKNEKFIKQVHYAI